MKRTKLAHFGNLNRRSWPYVVMWILYDARVIVFTTWWTAAPITDEVYGTDFRAMLHSALLRLFRRCDEKGLVRAIF